MFIARMVILSLVTAVLVYTVHYTCALHRLHSCRLAGKATLRVIFCQ
jgi:hypothetical protein